MNNQNIKLSIGSVIPNFKLKSTDEKFYLLESFDSAKYLLVIFSCNHCPYVQAYEERIISLQDEFLEEGLRVIAINSNDAATHPEDSFEKMQQRAKEKSFNFYYLHDEDQSVAKAFDAVSTPEIFLFDEKRRLVYTGKVDDNWREPERVNSRYLRDAILELISGVEVSVPETFAIGCSIKWKNKN